MKFLAEIEISEVVFDELDKEEIKKLLTNCSITLKKVDIPTYGTDNMLLRTLCEENGFENWRSIELSVLYEKEILLTRRVYNCLNKGKIMTLGDLTDKTVKQLRELPGFGWRSLEVIQEMLESLDLCLKES